MHVVTSAQVKGDEKNFTFIDSVIQMLIDFVM